MLTASDLLRLPCTPDLTEAGIAYACRSLAYARRHMGGSSFAQLRHTVAAVAVELAFRRSLRDQAIPFKVQRAMPFTDPDHYDISLGGHRCEVKSYVLSRREQITTIRQDPAQLLQAPALIPLDEFAGEDHRPDDLYIFAFLLGLEAVSRKDVEKALAAGRSTYFAYLLPKAWASPSAWLPLEGLTLLSRCPLPLAVELGGLDAGREFVTARLELPPGQPLHVEQSFYSLAYVHALEFARRLSRTAQSAAGQAHLIAPSEWGNIWIYGMEILLTGWLSREEFRRRASSLNAGLRTFQYARTRTKNLLVPVAGLQPLGELFEKVRLWKKQKAGSSPSSLPSAAALRLYHLNLIPLADLCRTLRPVPPTTTPDPVWTCPVGLMSMVANPDRPAQVSCPKMIGLRCARRANPRMTAKIRPMNTPTKMTSGSETRSNWASPAN